MRSRFDEEGGPDIKVVVAEYRDAMRKRLRWVGPAVGGILIVLVVLSGLFSVEPGEVAVVRTFGKAAKGPGELRQPGLHFALPIVQQYDKVNLTKIRRAEIGFRSTKNGPKRVDSEAEMLTGDENIVEAQMIVQYRVEDPLKFLFKLKDPEDTLMVASEVALRGVVGQMTITSAIEDFAPRAGAAEAEEEETDPAEGEEAADKPGNDEPKDDEPKDDEPKDEKPKEKKKKKKADDDGTNVVKKQMMPVDESTDILTKGRERAQIATAEQLQKLMNLYESGILITEVKLLPVDVPDAVKDAFHDVVRAREEREQKINKALGYREDRIPRARGQAQKVVQAAEAYKQERVLRSEGEVARYLAVLAEYRKARGVTRERLHLETMERILGGVQKKVFIDQGVAENALPLLNLGGANVLGGQNQGGQ